MPINRREAEAVVAVRWTHKVSSKYFDELFFASRKERIVSASPALHWMIGHRFDKVREVCAMRGWTLIDLRSNKQVKVAE
jgi:hypothetical protein